MAQLSLSYLGNAIGGPLGGFVGNLLGGWIDQRLFGRGGAQEGPRLDDLRVTASTYGRPIPLSWGPENRIGGNIIWSSGLIETAKRRRVGGKGGPSTSITEYSYRVSLAIALSGRGIRRVRRIWANGEAIFDAGASTAMVFSKADGTHDVFDTLRVYPGDFDQLPDPTVESYVGAADAPAYRGTAYVVIADLQLADFGNRVPNLEFLVEADEAISVGGVLLDICERAGLNPMEVGTSGLTAPVRGYTVASGNTCHQAIEPLSLVYDFDAAEVWGGLRFQRRALGPSGSILLEDLAGHEIPNARPEPIRWTRDAETELPYEATVSYHDPDRDYQVSSQSARRITGTAQSSLSAEIAIVMDAALARAAADRLLWESWTSRAHAQTTLTDRWLALEAGRSYVIESPLGPERLRLERSTRGANGVIEAMLRRDRIEVYRSDAVGAPAPVPANPVRLTGPSILQLADCPILQDEDDDAGFYWFVTGTGPGWRGADVQRSSDAGSTWGLMGSSGAAAIMGTLTTSLQPGPTDVFHQEGEFTVQLDNADEQLDSVGELELLNGANACWIGTATGADGEVLQFRDVEVLGAGLYRVSVLLRGRVGTERITPHGAGRRFVLLEGFSLNRSSFGAADWNHERLYRAVSLLQAETSADVQAFTNTGRGRQPLSPVHVRGARDESNNLTVSWKRRSRIRQPGLGNGPLALGENAPAYEVDIIVSGNAVRTIAGSSESVSYSAAEQSADGITPGNPVTVDVYQISDSRGRGIPRRAII